MLQIPLDSSWETLNPDEVADLILRRRLERSTPARDDARNPRVGALEQMLGPEHFDVLSRALLGQLGAIYEGVPDGLDLPSLERRVAELAGWVLTGPGERRIRLRLMWLSAWLADLMGHDDEALRRYDAFLRLEPRGDEPQLCLLARNNAAVLNLRRGSLVGLSDLVHAAVVSRLPGACFSLLNLVIRTWKDGTLARIDPGTMGVLCRLDRDLRASWIGPDRDGATGAGKTADRSLSKEPDALLRFVDALIRHSFPIRPGEPVAQELRLWSLTPELLVAGRPRGGPPGAPACHAGYAEAVSLLYTCDIPGCLGEVSDPGPSAEEVVAQKQIALARESLARDEPGPAREMRRPARALLQGRADGPRLKKTRDEIDRLLRDVDTREQNLRSSRFRLEWVALTEQVDRACQAETPTEAQNRRDFLAGEFRRVRALQAAVLPGCADDLTAALVCRLDEHIDRLEARDRRTALQVPYERLQELLPTDLSAPVARQAYEELKLCRQADPDGRVQDWGAILRSFERHDARSYFHQAFRCACDRDRRDQREIKHLLWQAIAREAGYAPYAAPLMALLCLPQEQETPESFDQIRAELIARANRLVGEIVDGAEPMVPPGVWQDVIADIVHCIRRAINPPGWDSDVRAVESMTRGLWEIFKPVLRYRPLTDIEVVEQILTLWRSACPNRIDPRHPIHDALCDLRVSKLLAQARQLLEACADDPTLRFEGGGPEVANRQQAMGLIIEAAQLGLFDREQTRVLVRLYVLARPLPGPPRHQAKVLDALEARLETLPDEAIGDLSVAMVERWIVAADPSPREPEDQSSPTGSR